MQRRIAAALLFAAALPLRAQPGPTLSPGTIPINSHTDGDQTAPRTVMAGDGTFVVTWYSKEDPAHTRVWARWFDVDGAPMADQFQVSESAVGDQLSPAISGSGPGDVVIAWESTFQDGDQSGIYARRYIGGNPDAVEFRVNTETAGNQHRPAVASAADGSFVVVWETDHADATAAEIVGQRYDSTGAPVGSEFPVNDPSDGNQMWPAVAMDYAGAFVVTWEGDPSDNPAFPDIHARIFKADGTPDGGAFRVNTTVDFDQTLSAVETEPAGSGRFMVVWSSTPEVGDQQVRGRIFDGARPEGPDFLIGTSQPAEPPSVSMEDGKPIVAFGDHGQIRIVTFDALGRPIGSADLDPDPAGGGASVASSFLGRFVVVWAQLLPSFDIDVQGRLGGAPTALGALVDPPATLGAPFNGILESGEQAVFAPQYVDTTDTELSLTGTLIHWGVDPPGAGGSVIDGTADYGTLAPMAPGDCLTATGDCYVVSAGRGPNLPGVHFDTGFLETLSNGFTKMWRLHVGGTFLDVDLSNIYYPFIESLAHADVAVGCGNADYCSDNPVSRAEMAVFLLKSRYGSRHLPTAATGTVFGDVPSDAFAAEWIEELAALGVTAGCGGGLYCPNDPVTRDQMAVFLLKTLEGSGYTPPDATGIFGDVPADDPFAPWIEDLASRQVTGGCQASPLLYCPHRSTSRGEMAVFLTKTFALVVYGP